VIDALRIPSGVQSVPTGSFVGVDRGGDISVGVDAVYLSTWKAGVSYTHYYGNAAGFLNAAFTNTFQQNMKDRDFLSFTITRTF